MREIKVKNIGSILRERDLITEHDLQQAQHMQGQVGGLLGQSLLRLGAVSEEDLLIAQSDQFSLPIMLASQVSNEPDDYSRAMQTLNLKPRWMRARNCAVWQCSDGGPVHLIARHIYDANIRETLESKCETLGLELRDYVAGNQALELARFQIQDDDLDFAAKGLSDDDAARLREMAEEAPVIDFVNRIFSMALKDNASDIHIEPFEHKFQVRYRIDGILHNRQTESRGRFDAVASRIKLLSGMDIAERRLPQDGRQTIRFAGQDIDLRVSSLPGSWGESLVMRLLRKENELPDLEALGLEGHAKSILQNLLSHPNGVILVTGPTGSGKSTTLYRSLQGLNNGLHKIITIEDPVEYDMDGIIQIQTNSNIGYTFAQGVAPQTPLQQR